MERKRGQHSIQTPVHPNWLQGWQFKVCHVLWLCQRLWICGYIWCRLSALPWLSKAYCTSFSCKKSFLFSYLIDHCHILHSSNLRWLYFVHFAFQRNSDIALVQARWSFVNKEENLLTRLQNINLCFHFEVEQQVNGFFLNFFGFNGTAGVWRIKALEDSGGWLERTTVEDMDIAVRAHLNGWKFIYLNDVKVPCELPESYEAYKKQQYRWHSGPMQLFRLCLPAILSSKVCQSCTLYSFSLLIAASLISL